MHPGVIGDAFGQLMQQLEHARLLQFLAQDLGAALAGLLQFLARLIHLDRLRPRPA